MQALIFAMLVATVPGQAPDNQAAFFTEEGIEQCRTLAEALNKSGTETLYVCEVDNG